MKHKLIKTFEEEVKIQKELTGFSNEDFLVDSSIRNIRGMDRLPVATVGEIFSSLRKLTDRGMRIEVDQTDIENNLEKDLYRISVYSEIYRDVDDTIIDKIYLA